MKIANWGRIMLFASSAGIACCAIPGNSGPVRAQGSPNQPLTGVILSDIHFDPSAKAPTQEKRWPDSNKAAMDDAIREAKSKSPRLIFYTGDMIGHNIANGPDQAYAATLANDQPDVCKAGEIAAYRNREADACTVVQALQTPPSGAASTVIPVIIALGNNDAADDDYKMRPNDPMFTYLADKINVIRDAADPDARADFKYGGFYCVPDPTVADLDIIVLNTTFWCADPAYAKYDADEANSYPGFADPGKSELWWLGYKLGAARAKKHKVRLVMHIPPGIDAFRSEHPPKSPGTTQPGKQVMSFWKTDFESDFLALMRQYKGTVITSFAAHTHQDEFRLISDTDDDNDPNNTPFLAIRVSPSVSRSNHTNSAYSLFTYDGQSGDIEDITTFYKPMASPDSGWTSEYRFSTTYGYPAAAAYNAKNLRDLAMKIRKGPANIPASVFSSWITLYNVSSTPAEFTDTDWLSYSCAQTNLTNEGFSSCSKLPLPQGR